MAHRGDRAARVVAHARDLVDGSLLTAALGLEVLRRQTAREFPDAERGDVPWWSLPQRGQPAPAPSTEDERIERLGRLAELHATGVLDDAEFAREKERVLSGAAS
jgi:hypothetical protein